MRPPITHGRTMIMITPHNDPRMYLCFQAIVRLTEILASPGRKAGSAMSINHPLYDLFESPHDISSKGAELHCTTPRTCLTDVS